MKNVLAVRQKKKKVNSYRLHVLVKKLLQPFRSNESDLFLNENSIILNDCLVIPTSEYISNLSN